ncbi:MAG TPA: AMP-binding protein [Pseudonocardia sp.]|jgi:long-chain acyl-CoA synthetase|nr:AMP-binding protein [Pseudonocardia sp.]
MIVSAPVSLSYPVVPAGAVLAGAAARWGDRIALHDNGRELSYADWYRRSCQFANGLRASGINTGDVVAIHLPNCLEFAIAYHGILLAGATYTPANPLLPPNDLAHQLTDSGAVLALSFTLPPERGTNPLDSVREQTPVRRVLHPGPEFEAFLADQPDSRPDISIDPATALAHLAYTGGTTGRSKGVALTHRNVVTNALQFGCWRSGSVPVRDDEGGLTIEQVQPESEFPNKLGDSSSISLAPWFHAMGTVGSLQIAPLVGATQVLHLGLDPGRYLADIEKFAITSLGGAPPIYAALVRHPDFASRDLSSVRDVTSGAAPLAVELIKALRARFGEDVVITEGYGLTEVTMGATTSPGGTSGVRKVGTVGIPVPDTQIKLVADDSEVPLPVGERGEVCIRGPQVMTEYLNRPDETSATLVDGWLHTGDIGVLDEDGYLAIVDRKKDMLIYKGYNVYPRQLEELLYAQAGVSAAAVVGKLDPDVGELPVAFVVGADLDREKLRDTVNDQLLPYQKIREVHLVESLPVSAAGKVLKRELRERLR